MIRLLVFGGRDYPWRAHVWEEIQRLCDGIPMTDITIIHGGATGVDYFAHLFCRLWVPFGLTELPFPALWDVITIPGAVIRKRRDGSKYNVIAGFQRNQKMLDDGKPTHALCFPGGNGTADMRERIELANKHGANIELHVIEKLAA